MAHKIPNKFINDNHPRKAIGFRLPINADAVFTSTYTTKDQLRSNLINYFMTNKGERVFNPSFGADIKKIIFEPLNDHNENIIFKRIENDLKNQFPLLKVNKLEIIDNKDQQSLFINLDYSIVQFNINDQLTITI